MPMIRLIPNVVRYALSATYTNGRPIVTVLHYRVDDSVPGASRADRLSTHAARVRDAWQSEIMDLCSTGYAFQGIAWLDLDSEEGSTGSLGANGALPTAGPKVTTSFAAPSICVLVRKNITGARGARRGRMYLPWLDEADTTHTGSIQSTFVTTAQGKADAFFTAAQNIIAAPDGGAKMIVPDYPRIPTPQPNTLVGRHSYVLSLTVENVQASQRRRVRP